MKRGLRGIVGLSFERNGTSLSIAVYPIRYGRCECWLRGFYIVMLRVLDLDFFIKGVVFIRFMMLNIQINVK